MIVKRFREASNEVSLERFRQPKVLANLQRDSRGVVLCRITADFGQYFDASQLVGAGVQRASQVENIPKNQAAFSAAVRDRDSAIDPIFQTGIEPQVAFDLFSQVLGQTKSARRISVPAPNRHLVARFDVEEAPYVVEFTLREPVARELVKRQAGRIHSAARSGRKYELGHYPNVSQRKALSRRMLLNLSLVVNRFFRWWRFFRCHVSGGPRLESDSTKWLDR